MLVVAFVVLALVVVGLLLWATERHRNAEYFGGPPLDGIAGGVWLSLAMLVTTQYADQSPRSLAGRFVSTLWVIASIFLFTVFTGIVTSALTVQQIDGRVRGVSDLPNLRVGTLQGSTSIDAFVYDAPVLKHLALTEFAGRVVVLGGTFAPQDYAIALPKNSPLREAINRELLAIKQSDIWAQRVFQYIGDR
jgi:ABC-type amino acid transport substrate-binding protein